MVPGVDCHRIKMLMARAFAYADAHRAPAGGELQADSSNSPSRPALAFKDWCRAGLKKCLTGLTAPNLLRGPSRQPQTSQRPPGGIPTVKWCVSLYLRPD